MGLGMCMQINDKIPLLIFSKKYVIHATVIDTVIIAESTCNETKWVEVKFMIPKREIIQMMKRATK